MKDRVTMLPENPRESLSAIGMERAKLLHNDDLEGYGSMYLPYALEQQYPKAALEWA